MTGLVSKHSVLKWIYRIEDSTLVLVLLGSILLAVWQIIMRNFFDSSLIWADPLLRIAVLWIGLLGSMIASRNNDHISIDILSHYLPTEKQRYVTAVVALFTVVVCASVAFYSASFVKEEYVYESIAFGDTPVWIFQIIIPIAFFVMSLRYLGLFGLAMLGHLPEKSEGEA